MMLLARHPPAAGSDQVIWINTKSKESKTTFQSFVTLDKSKPQISSSNSKNTIYHPYDNRFIIIIHDQEERNKL